MPIELVHTAILVSTIGLSFFLIKGPFSPYDLQITALIFIGYFIVKKFLSASSRFQLFDAVIATLIISNVVNSTGSLSSPFFFLNYFLIFTLSLLLEPIISITTTLALVFIYLITSPDNQSLIQFLPLFSLPFLTPFAVFLGEEYRQVTVKNTKLKDSNFLVFLVIRRHLKRLKELTENFLGDHELAEIKKTLEKLDKSLDQYEKNQ